MLLLVPLLAGDVSTVVIVHLLVCSYLAYACTCLRAPVIACAPVYAWVYARALMCDHVRVKRETSAC